MPYVVQGYNRDTGKLVDEKVFDTFKEAEQYRQTMAIKFPADRWRVKGSATLDYVRKP
jgi:hypothetical protein